MSEKAIIEKLREIEMPEQHHQYYEHLVNETYRHLDAAREPKATKRDLSGVVETKVAFDLADRVAKMHDIEIAEPLRELLGVHGKEITALMLAQEIAQGKYMPPDTDLEARLDMAVRVGLAIVTEGVTIAPLQGIAEVTIKENKDRTKYLSVSIAGPMRSAGGTESAVTMLIADHVRKTAGLDKYQANSFDDETGRFVEEIQTYIQNAGSFQYSVQEEDVVTVISNLPVELDGTDTDPVEVVNHKSMKRIKTDRVRGGALRVLNDGLIGRSKKLLKRIEAYKLDGWEWLRDLKGATQSDDAEDAPAKRMREVITGRSVLSMPNSIGGFRLRYGRACNTGFATAGLHPVISEILDHTVTVGTQIKMDIPGKGATIAMVDSIETPTVRLKDGSVIRIKNVEHGIKVKYEIDKILHLGDILISYGDFVENNVKLVPTGYVEEYWIEELRDATKESTTEHKRFMTETPTLKEALEISENLHVPLHPKYLFFWDHITPDELEKLLHPASAQDGTIQYATRHKAILERLGVPHTVDENVILQGTEAAIFQRLLLENKITAQDGTVPEILTRDSGIPIMPKHSTSIGARVGRPEKAAPRKMKPPTHVLFPVGSNGGASRDLLKAAGVSDFTTRISNRHCPKCRTPSIGIRCIVCGAETRMEYYCPSCRAPSPSHTCPQCSKSAMGYSYQKFPLREMLHDAQERMQIRVQTPFKGVMEMINQDRLAEPLEKGAARQREDLTVFKDGTVRFDATNCPLTHFRPAWIRTPIPRLRELGYTQDIDGRPLTEPDQTVELLTQDIIIPIDAGKYLARACRYIDYELAQFFGAEPFYRARQMEDLVGHLVIGLAPHTSVGIVGRVIGFTNTHVCFATPNWHSAKRRDADGDADAIMMLMDVLLNFSRKLLSGKIGGLMDAPLLIQPLVFPHESQSQAHNLEVVKQLPRAFFQSTLSGAKAAGIDSVELVRDRLETPRQFAGYDFTHETSILESSKPRSAYSTLESMLDKLDLQLKNADIINAVDADELVSNLITTHLVPDIMGNLGSYARQGFRCTACNASYRRPPLAKKCKCGNQLIQTINRSSVSKYLKLAKRLVERYNVSNYQKNRISALSDEIDLVLGKSQGDQSLLSDFISAS